MKNKEVTPFKAPDDLFAADDAKRKELEKSDNILDLLTAVLMDTHVEGGLTPESDAFGLWYSFARPKAAAILERFNVTVKGA